MFEWSQIHLISSILINLIMRPDIDVDGNDFLAVDQELDCQPVAEREGDGVDSFEFASGRDRDFFNRVAG